MPKLKKPSQEDIDGSSKISSFWNPGRKPGFPGRPKGKSKKKRKAKSAATNSTPKNQKSQKAAAAASAQPPAKVKKKPLPRVN